VTDKEFDLVDKIWSACKVAIFRPTMTWEERDKLIKDIDDAMKSFSCFFVEKEKECKLDD